MYKAKKNILKINVILITVFLLINIPLSLVLVYIENIPTFLSFFNEYVEHGRAIFLPSFPKINILGFLPNHESITKFTFGHLFDIIIVVNLIFLVETIAYHFYVKKKVNDKKFQKLVGFQVCLADYIEKPSLENYPCTEGLEYKANVMEDPILLVSDDYCHELDDINNKKLIDNATEKLDYTISTKTLLFHNKYEIGPSSSDPTGYSTESVSLLYLTSFASLVKNYFTYSCIQNREVCQ